MRKDVLAPENIKINAAPKNKEEAVRSAGEILVRNGYVDDAYIEKMLEREEKSSTYMGNFLAIPHGTEDSTQYIHATGISVVTIPKGVDFGDGNIVKVIFGIAGENDEHLDLLANIAIVCSHPGTIEDVLNAKSEEAVIRLFSEVE